MSKFSLSEGKMKSQKDFKQGTNPIKNRNRLKGLMRKEKHIFWGGLLSSIASIPAGYKFIPRFVEEPYGGLVIGVIGGALAGLAIRGLAKYGKYSKEYYGYDPNSLKDSLKMFRNLIYQSPSRK